MVDKKSIAILVLLALVTFAGVGWIRVATRPTSDGPPAENLTRIFPGYENYLNRGIYLAVMSGHSMAPTINEGDLILWVKTDPDELKVDDIVLMYYKLPWRPGPENIAHRIRDVQVDGKRTFLTRGDNAWKPDGWVPEDNIFGLVIGVVYRAATG